MPDEAAMAISSQTLSGLQSTSITSRGCTVVLVPAKEDTVVRYVDKHSNLQQPNKTDNSDELAGCSRSSFHRRCPPTGCSFFCKNNAESAWQTM